MPPYAAGGHVQDNFSAKMAKQDIPQSMKEQAKVQVHITTEPKLLQCLNLFAADVHPSCLHYLSCSARSLVTHLYIDPTPTHPSFHPIIHLVIQPALKPFSHLSSPLCSHHSFYTFNHTYISTKPSTRQHNQPSACCADSAHGCGRNSVTHQQSYSASPSLSFFTWKVGTNMLKELHRVDRSIK